MAERKTRTKSRSQRRGYRGLSATELDQQRHDRIIGAAIVLFSEQGYNSTRIDRICTRAHVSTRHFYEQFDNRIEVLTAVHDRITATLTDEIRTALTRRDEKLTRRLENAIENTMRRLLSEPEYARILCVESVGVSADMELRRREAMRKSVMVVRRYTERMVRQGKLPEGDYYLIAVGLVGLLNELVVEWLSEPSRFSAEQMAVKARDMFMAMLFHS